MSPSPTSNRSAPLRSGASPALLALLALLLCGAGAPQPAAGPGLADGLVLERALRGGETHAYPVEIQAGQFLRVIVREEGIDLAVRLFDPQGTEITGVDGLVAGHSDEDLAAIAPISGLYRLEIRGPNPKAEPGRYRLRVEGPRPAAGDDGARAEAVKAVWDAVSEHEKGDEARQRQDRAIERAIPLWQRLGEQRRMAEAYSLLGDLWTAPEPGRAAENFRQAAALWGSQPDREAKIWQIRCLNSAGVLLSHLGQPAAARKVYEEALAVANASGDPRSQAVGLSNLALLDVDQGELRKGIEGLLAALQKSRESGDRTAQARTLNNLGYAYDQLAERQKAIDLYQQGLDLARASSNREAEANALNNLAASYFSLGDWDAALKDYRQVLVLTRTLDPREQAKVLISLGNTYARLGKLDAARTSYLQALALGRTMKDAEVQTLALTAQAFVFIKLKQPAQALEPARQALRLAQGFHDREALALDALGIALRDSGDLKSAREELTRALSLARDREDRSSEAEIRLALARTEQRDGHLTAALDHVRSAVSLVESFRNKVPDPELRASFLATKQDVYELYIDTLMSLPGAGGAVAEALQVSEQARARSLLDLLNESGTDVRRGIDPALARRERRLRDQLNTRDADRARLLGEEKPDRKRLEEADRKLEDALDEYRQLQAEQRASSPEYAALTQPQPLTVAEIQAQVLDGRALLLEYSLGARRSFLWAVSPRAVASFELPGRDRIETLARRYYDLLTARNRQRPGESPADRKRRIDGADADAGRVGRELSRLILGPAERLLGDRPLLIVADGALQYIPFAALPTPSSGSPLAARHEVVSLPSASALAVLRREVRARAKAPKTLAVIADPVFERTDERLPPAPGKVKRLRLAAVTRGDGGGWSPGEARRAGEERLSFRRLRSAEKEARAIAALVPPDQLSLALGFQASRARVLRPELAQYRNVHFATHGVLDSRRPELSKLVLSLFDERGKPQDGFLRLNDVYNLRLGADLVTLSACQTALGKEVRGEGLIGLTRGFMYAGAARVLASLWSVEDRPTADLMASFYRGMLREGLTPAAALRKAQLEMAKNPLRISPYFWAGFSLQGEWN